MALNAKPLFLTDNIMDLVAASITASSSAANNPPEYAVDDFVWRWWLAAGFGTAYLNMDAGSVVSVDTLSIGVHNLFSANASVSLEKGERTTVVSDAFDDSSFDAVNFGAILAGGGTVTETTSLATLSNVGAQAAFVYDKNSIASRTDLWRISHHLKNITTGTDGVPALMLHESAAAPAAGATSFKARTENKAGIYQDGTGLYFIYRDTGGTLYYFNGASWATTPASAYTGALNTQYIARMYSDGGNIIYELWDSAESVLHATATIALASVQVDGNTDYFLFGDMDNTAAGSADIVSTLWEHLLDTNFIDVVSAFTPASDLAFIKKFVSTSSRIWRFKIVTAAVAPYIGFMKIGERMDFSRYINDGWDPKPQAPDVVTGRAQKGPMLSSTVDSVAIPLSISLSNLTDAWVNDTLLPVMEEHILLGRPWVISWDSVNHASQVFIGSVPDNYGWNAPYARSRRTTTIQMDCLRGL